MKRPCLCLPFSISTPSKILVNKRVNAENLRRKQNQIQTTSQHAQAQLEKFHGQPQTFLTNPMLVGELTIEFKRHIFSIFHANGYCIGEIVGLVLQQTSTLTRVDRTFYQRRKSGPQKSCHKESCSQLVATHATVVAMRRRLTATTRMEPSHFMLPATHCFVKVQHAEERNHTKSNNAKHNWRCFQFPVLKHKQRTQYAQAICFHITGRIVACCTIDNAHRHT